ncbi:MAG TPA: aspartate-semialdehyde dehydrogenase, partial [Phycisphaerales bacterium]|nr:aspartate-semialdehyde dehydrogenase [Phycisphaerales bacterium]
MEPSLAIVGATGAVGREMLAVLEQRRFPHRELRLLASERSTGTTLRYCNEPHPVRALSAGSLDGVDLALFAAGGSVARDLAPAAAARGTTVIDNSSAFRLAPGVPLVVPEINPGALRSAPLKTPRDWPGIIANPNCSTILLLMALTPLRRAFGLERVVVSTYQAASGAGARGMDELTTQTRTALAGGEPRPSVFHEPYAFNLFSHNTAIDPRTGLNVEEQKIIDETRKIWDDPGLR